MPLILTRLKTIVFSLVRCKPSDFLEDLLSTLSTVSLQAAG
jgi:hypothetical protein